MKTRDDVVRLAQSLLKQKVRFRPYGREPKYGMDCIGLAIWISYELELLDRKRELPTYSFPPSEANFRSMAEILTPADEILPGRLLVFTDNDGRPRHVGVVSHQREGVWKVIGSIPNTLQFGQFGLLPGLSDHIWGIFDFPNVA